MATKAKLHWFLLGCVCLSLLGLGCFAQNPAADVRRLEGKWAILLGDKGEKEYLGDGRFGVFEIKGNELSYQEDESEAVYTFALDPTKTPKQITLVYNRGKSPRTDWLGIYEVSGNQAKICLSRFEKRPSAFDRKQGELFYQKK